MKAALTRSSRCAGAPAALGQARRHACAHAAPPSPAPLPLSLSPMWRGGMVNAAPAGPSPHLEVARVAGQQVRVLLLQVVRNDLPVQQALKGVQQLEGSANGGAVVKSLGVGWGGRGAGRGWVNGWVNGWGREQWGQQQRGVRRSPLSNTPPHVARAVSTCSRYPPRPLHWPCARMTLDPSSRPLRPTSAPLHPPPPTWMMIAARRRSSSLMTTRKA